MRAESAYEIAWCFSWCIFIACMKACMLSLGDIFTVVRKIEIVHTIYTQKVKLSG